MSTSSPNASTRGQRRGFYWQDWYAAWTMLRCWAEPAEGIRAVAPEADDALHVDDVVIYRDDAVTYSQLKHTVNDDGFFTGADLFGATGEEKPLIAKLYRGWKLVSGRGKVVRIRLVTNARASARSNNHTVAPHDLERRVLAPLRTDPNWIPSGPLVTIVEKIRSLADAPDTVTLLTFLRDLEFEFNAPAEGALQDDIVRILRQRLRPAASAQNEAAGWLHRVYDLSTLRGGGSAYSRADIDRELRQIFGSAGKRVEHRLALPESHLTRPQVASAILDAADKVGSGYLTVFGPPGCGKTTLATWLADQFPSRVAVRYHLFDPRRTAALERKARSSSLQFVETLLDVLSERFPAEVPPFVPTADTLDDAVEALWQALEAVGKVGPNLVMIDGLDHALRVGMDVSKLLDALRQQAPRGIVILLFGQPDWPYPAWITAVARLNVPSFSANETRAYVCARFGWQADDPPAAAVADRLHDRSQGNPLSLFYNVMSIEGLASDPANVAAHLDSVRLFAGRPHETYGQLLHDIVPILPMPRNSESLRSDLLAYFATAAAAITVTRLQAAFAGDGLTEREAKDFLLRLRPVVVDDGDGKFWLFHDDFRRYAEDYTSVEQRKSAHARHASALTGDWHDEELSALSEHLWLGGCHSELAELPRSRMLDEWVSAAPKHAVLATFQLAIAAQLRLGDDVGIMRSALAAARAIEVLGELKAHGDEPPAASGLGGWSFVVPPRLATGDSLLKRASALGAAASGCAADPALAAEIASRFLLPDSEVPDADDRDAYHLDHYVGAWARWLIRSGEFGGLRQLLSIGGTIGWWSTNAVVEEAMEEVDPALLDSWTAALRSLTPGLDRGLARAAFEHLVADRPEAAGSIARALAHGGAADSGASRDALAILSMIAGERLLGEAHLSVGLFWNERNSTEAHHWAGFFFHGFAEGLAGRSTDFSTCTFPQEILSALSASPSGADNARLAAYIWRLGCACGYAVRNPGLLTPRDATTILKPLATAKLTGLRPIQQWAFASCAKAFLPIMSRVLARDELLRAAARDVVWPEAEKLRDVPGSLSTGLLESLWLLDSGAWRALAIGAHGVQVLPGSEGAERISWYSYWTERGSSRGVPAPPAFVRQGRVAELGVARKTDPAWLAVSLLKQLPPARLREATSEMVDLLIQLDQEPEGTRSAYRNLPSVLQFCLAIGPAFFRDEFIRATEEYGVAEPFGDTSASLALHWLRDASMTLGVSDLMALWGWISACAGAFGRESRGPEAGRLISQRLRALGEIVAAQEVEDWVSALRPPERANEASTPAAATSRPTPRIEDVTPRWFSSWWGSEEHQVLLGHLEAGGEAAWRQVCASLAVRIAAGDFMGYELQTLGEDLPSVRPGMASDAAYEVATEHLREKVRFQRPPGGRESESRCIEDASAAFISLLGRGLDVADVETVSRTLRSLTALARFEGTRTVVEQELRTRLSSADPRTLAYCLAVLRTFPQCTGETLSRVRALVTHPDAWCRWLASRIVGQRPAWSPMRPISGRPGLINPGDSPVRREVGASFYAGTSAVAEVYVKKLGCLLDVDEDDLRSWLEVERASLDPAPSRPLGWNRQQGHGLTTERVSEAAGRLAARLASDAGSSLHALLSVVARFDPWVALAAPCGRPPEGWFEVCRAEQSESESNHVFVLASLGVTRDDNGPECTAEILGEAGSLYLHTKAPKEFAWVAEATTAMPPPNMERGPVIPLSFMNRPFTELGRDRFTLVPRWDFPQFGRAVFRAWPRPAWVNEEGHELLVAVYRESNSGGYGTSHPRVSWQTAWFADPHWLRGFLQPGTRLVRFWRSEAGKRHDDDVEPTTVVEYGSETVTLEAAPR